MSSNKEEKMQKYGSVQGEKGGAGHVAHQKLIKFLTMPVFNNEKHIKRFVETNSKFIDLVITESLYSDLLPAIITIKVFQNFQATSIKINLSTFNPTIYCNLIWFLKQRWGAELCACMCE